MRVFKRELFLGGYCARLTDIVFLIMSVVAMKLLYKIIS